jgi:hypothetical protein
MGEHRIYRSACLYTDAPVNTVMECRKGGLWANDSHCC